MVNENGEEPQPQTWTFDRATLAAIYDDYHPRLYRYIYRRTGHVDVAQDLTAVVFQRLLLAVQAGAGPEQHLSAWLYRVAHNLIVDHYRRQQHEQHFPLNETLVATGDDLEQAADQAFIAEQVRAAVCRLTHEQQQVITLKFLEGLSNAEVAAILEKPVGAVKSLQHRALVALQRCLVPTGEIA